MLPKNRTLKWLKCLRRSIQFQVKEIIGKLLSKENNGCPCLKDTMLLHFFACNGEPFLMKVALEPYKNVFICLGVALKSLKSRTQK